MSLTPLPPSLSRKVRLWRIFLALVAMNGLGKTLYLNGYSLLQAERPIYGPDALINPFLVAAYARIIPVSREPQ